MNQYFILSVFIILFNLIINAQGENPPMDKEITEKIYQLEKIKLIEVLEMDEETSIRFFARRAEFKKETDEIQEKMKEIINSLEDIDKGGKVYTKKEIASSITDYNNLSIQMTSKKVDFINSLNDILSYEQISRFIVFERKFKNELRRSLFKERKKHNQQN